jgi:hypothetical protein
LREKIEFFVAKTGYGKSVVPQLLPLIMKNSIVFTLLPLNALGAEQLEDIEKLPLAKPFWLHAENNKFGTNNLRSACCDPFLERLRSLKQREKSTLILPYKVKNPISLSLPQRSIVIPWCVVNPSFNKIIKCLVGLPENTLEYFQLLT